MPPGADPERRTDPRLSHGFAVGDRVRRTRRRGARGRLIIMPGVGTVTGIPTPIVPEWPERVTVRWDEFRESFDRNCNDNPERDSVPPTSLRLTPRG